MVATPATARPRRWTLPAWFAILPAMPRALAVAALLAACTAEAPPPAAAPAPVAPPPSPAPPPPEPITASVSPPITRAFFIGPDRYTLPSSGYRECEISEAPICGAHIVDLATGSVTEVYTHGADKPGWLARDDGGPPRSVTVDFIATPTHPDRLTTSPAGPGGGIRLTLAHPTVPGTIELPDLQWLSAEIAAHRGKLYGLGTRIKAPNKPALLEIDPTTAAVRDITIAGVQFGDVYPGQGALIAELSHKRKSTLARVDPVAGKIITEVALPASKDFEKLCKTGGPVVLDNSGITHVEGDRVYGGFGCIPDE